MAIAKDDFDAFMNQCRIKLIGASDSGIKEELFDVLDEFCEYSGAWQETLTVPVLAGTTSGGVSTNVIYTLNPSHDGYIIRLVGVWDPNVIPQPAFMPTFDGGPNAVGPLQLVNPVNQNQTFTVTVAKTVKRPTTRDNIPIFSDTLFRRYHRVLQDGVVGKLMGQPNKPFSNTQMAQTHQARFQQGISTARVQVQRQNTLGAQAWSFPQTFRTRGQRGGVSTANPTSF
jgi:hypothetical protein